VCVDDVGSIGSVRMWVKLDHRRSETFRRVDRNTGCKSRISICAHIRDSIRSCIDDQLRKVVWENVKALKAF